MENLKDWFNVIFELLQPLLKIFIYIALIGFLVSGLSYFLFKIDESKLGDIRYCPSCGIDLINK